MTRMKQWVKNPAVSTKLLLAGALGFTAVVTGCNSNNQLKAGAQKPNIVLIFADDLGYGDLSCNGATRISTPAIDQLAAEGINFTNAYASSSICSPSRYSLMTGEYAWRTRLKWGVLKYFDKPLIEQEQTTMASLLKRNGYHTAIVGKWHLGFDWKVNDNAPENPDQTVFDTWDENVQDYIDFSKPVGGGPVERGFDYFYGMAGSNNMKPYVYIENDRVTQAPSEPQLPYDHYKNNLKAPNWDIKTVNQVLTHKAVDVINNHFKYFSNNPLFLYFPTSAIHRPCLPTFTKGKSKAGLRGDIVVELDWTVNQIVTALKNNNAYENTLLIFTSDNGPRPGDPVLWLDTYAEGEYEDYHQDYFDDYSAQYVNEDGNLIWSNGWLTYDHDAAGEHLGFKSDAWDGGLKVPFIAHWPGKIDAGVVNENIICLSDLFATFAELVGDSLADNEGGDSYSFLSGLIDHEADQRRESLTVTSGASGAFIEIKDGWKYIEAAVPGRWPETYYPDGPNNLEPQLYNLRQDAMEQQNLYGTMQDKVSELQRIIETVKTTKRNEGN
ncbi:MAG: arylsulfatase [Bacteroidales bacterium]